MKQKTPHKFPAGAVCTNVPLFGAQLSANSNWKCRASNQHVQRGSGSGTTVGPNSAKELLSGACAKTFHRDSAESSTDPRMCFLTQTERVMGEGRGDVDQSTLTTGAKLFWFMRVPCKPSGAQQRKDNMPHAATRAKTYSWHVKGGSVTCQRHGM
eukprot:95198-Chlamydomonas_euryale.AAC.3